MIILKGNEAMNEMITLLKNHKSIRKFKAGTITEEALKAIVESAQAASTSGFFQAYSIIRVTDPNLRAAIARASGDQQYVETASEFLVFCADLKRMYDACDRHDIPYDKGMTETFIIATVDASLAAQNAMIAAEAMGLGGVYIGGLRNNIAEVSVLLELPEDVYPVFGLCIGYPNHDPAIKERLPMHVVLKQNHYTEDDAKAIEAYDQRIKAYYIERTKGRKTDTWTANVADKFASEPRSHMRDFLENQGFKLK
ncbi:oxygen-insensitive NADPH nitroreductase [Fusibacter paucivorans]|uniref:Oxygen-insensitive NADPH nitroreductase n=1 Tax=Fusibacter paucivorans TaxID=76009 RepID=A0ABS5PRD6_9FIRM|nr:oxygen-insensitive NADPH nitroreductase [Fusibacter paucivorans]MBS7527457.1 oxygen-insensitive NADPH nitroreductase [Fusibacter paucivorans]